MRVLITSSRLPFALGMVRQLAAAGHEVYAGDDYARSPGSHSKYLAGHYVYPSPRERTDDFIAELGRIAAEAGIEVIVPAFEEAFYIAARAADLPERVTAFTGEFGALARLPINQLVMHKLLVNQALYAQGLAATQALGTFFDGIARHTPEGFDFARRAAEGGFKEAVRDRDEPFGDFGLAGRPESET